MNKLAEYLAWTGVSQKEFAERIGVTQSAVSQFLHNRVTPGRRAALAIERETGGAVTVASWDQQGE